MGALSFWHLIVILAILGIYVFPIGKIVSRTGASGWWALLACVPLLNMVALWIFALAPWKIDAVRGSKSL